MSDPVPCPDCGCKVIRGAHYGAFEACNRIKTLKAEVANLRERWACVECGRTPDGGKSGDLYVSVCHGCHRCNACAEPMCTICGDEIGLRQRAIDLKAEVERLRVELEAHAATHAALDDANADLRARLALVVEALKRLRAETHGLVALERDGLIALVSLTNVLCVERAVEQANAALAAAQPEEKSR